jgi:hypothetical protein
MRAALATPTNSGRLGSALTPTLRCGATGLTLTRSTCLSQVAARGSERLGAQSLAHCSFSPVWGGTTCRAFVDPRTADRARGIGFEARVHLVREGALLRCRERVTRAGYALSAAAGVRHQAASARGAAGSVRSGSGRRAATERQAPSAGGARERASAATPAVATATVDGRDRRDSGVPTHATAARTHMVQAFYLFPGDRKCASYSSFQNRPSLFLQSAPEVSRAWGALLVGPTYQAHRGPQLFCKSRKKAFFLSVSAL